MVSAASSVPHPLSFRDFRLYLIARMAMVLAQNGMMIVIGWQTYTIARLTMSTQGAAAQLGLIGLAQFLPLFLLTPVSGWVADRFDRRRIAALANLLQIMCAAMLGIATWGGWISLPLIFSIAALLGIARCFSGPAMSSLAPRLVPREALPRAVAFSSLVWQGSSVIGPALGGYLFALQPYAAYVLAFGLFTVALLCFSVIRPLPPTQADRSRHPLRQMLDGLAYVRSNRLVLGAITLDLMAVLLAGSTALLPIYARDVYHVGAHGLGLLAAMPGLGAGITALMFAARPPAHNVGNKMLVSVALFGLATVIFGLTALMPGALAMPVGLVCLFVCGVTDMFSVFVRQTLIQVYTPDEMRGRVSSVSLLSISASNELGETESGFLAALVGPTAAIVAGGLGAMVVTLLWTRLFPELGLARSFATPETQPHDSAAQPAPK